MAHVNSIEAYRSLSNKELSNLQEQVLADITANGPATRLDLSHRMSIPINSLSNPVLRLVEAKLLVESDYFNETTGKKAALLSLPSVNPFTPCKSYQRPTKKAVKAYAKDMSDLPTLQQQQQHASARNSCRYPDQTQVDTATQHIESITKPASKREQLFSHLLTTPFTKVTPGYYSNQIVLDNFIVTVQLTFQPIE